MDHRSILFAPEATTETDLRGSQAALAAADIVVGGGGVVIKDRHGDADQALMALRAALAANALRDPAAPLEAELLGVPIGEVAALTLDGAHWFEVFGAIYRSAPLGGPVLRFQIAQAPGGKARKLGIGQGDSIAVRESAVVGVQRKGGEPVGPIRVRGVG